MSNTPKNFALQLGALVALYATIISVTTLFFGVITIAFPDPTVDYYRTESTTDTIRFAIASLVVVFPIYLWLTRRVNQIRRNDQSTYFTLTKWLIYGSLLIGGGVLAGDLVTVIYGFLNGELTTRFILKATVLALVVGHAFYYYLKDAQGYWQSHEKESIRFGMGAAAVVVAALVSGFYNSETPKEVRGSKLDTIQVGHLQDMQWRIEEYYRMHESLPATLNDIYRESEIPTPPEGRSEYTYKPSDDVLYELCAVFAEDSATNDSAHMRPVMLSKNYNWSHGTGEWCFERVIDNEYRQ